jgi:hypothetical protein
MSIFKPTRGAVFSLDIDERNGNKYYRCAGGWRHQRREASNDLIHRRGVIPRGLDTFVLRSGGYLAASLELSDEAVAALNGIGATDAVG